MRLYTLIIIGIIIMISISESTAVEKHHNNIKKQEAQEFAADIYAYYSDVRLAMREIETLAEAIHDYRDDHGAFPTSLQALIPDYLDYLPVSPWGTSYEYAVVDTTNFTVQIMLPRIICSNVSKVKHNADSFENYADCLLTDEEKLWLIYNQLRRIEQGIATYHVDYNQYPTSFQELLDDHYIEYVPLLDPYKHPYNYQLNSDSYTLSSYGKDGKQGGTHYNTDTIFSYDIICQTMIFFKHPLGYILDARPKMSVIKSGLGTYFVDWNYYPENLQELIDGMYLGDWRYIYDFYGKMFYYTRSPDMIHYTLIAAGKDGIPDTEDHELVMETGTFTHLPSFEKYYYSYNKVTYKRGIFEGGLLPQ